MQRDQYLCVFCCLYSPYNPLEQNDFPVSQGVSGAHVHLVLLVCHRSKINATSTGYTDILHIGYYYESKSTIHCTNDKNMHKPTKLESVMALVLR